MADLLGTRLGRTAAADKKKGTLGAQFHSDRGGSRLALVRRHGFSQSPAVVVSGNRGAT
jgi:hypothetical protein